MNLDKAPYLLVFHFVRVRVDPFHVHMLFFFLLFNVLLVIVCQYKDRNICAIHSNVHVQRRIYIVCIL